MDNLLLSQKVEELTQLSYELIEKYAGDEKEKYFARVQEITEQTNLFDKSNIKSIMDSVCESYGISSDEMINHKKAKRMAAYLIRTYTDLSLKSISEILGYETCIKVLRQIYKVKEKKQTSEKYNQRIEEVVKRLKEKM